MTDRGGFRIRRVGKALPPLGDDFISIEALSGLVLLAAAAAALIWANLTPSGYDEFWHQHLSLGIGDSSIDLSLRDWVNDGLMTIFFFVVGLEIKREVVRGELRDRRTASLPALAAIGGMVLPAVIYLAFNLGGDGVRGWAIPAATDIAFAVGVLAILGPRVPRQLKLFVLTLAIVDDIGAILVIALFYSNGIEAIWLGGAAVAIVAILLMQRIGIASPFWYVVPGLALWVTGYESGVHATIAGVILGLLTPAGPAHGQASGRPPIERLEHWLHPWSSFLIVPLFALANAGIVIDRAAIDRAVSSPITIGIVCGLVLGKTLGISFATAAGRRVRAGRLPDDVDMTHVVGGGAVAGIGFTVALFVADLAFTGPRFEEAVMGILAGSLISSILGVVILHTRARKHERPFHLESQL